jgi:PAS domain-containing protein
MRGGGRRHPRLASWPAGARIFLAAWTLLLLGVAMLSLRTLNWLPTNPITSYGMQIGSALEMLLFSFALASRIHVLRRDKEQAQTEALKAERLARETLEASERALEERIALRTAELAESTERSAKLAAMLRLMCDNVPDLIWAKDLEGRYLFANQAVCRHLLCAVDTSEPVGRTDTYFALRERACHPDDPRGIPSASFVRKPIPPRSRRISPAFSRRAGASAGDRWCWT